MEPPVGAHRDVEEVDVWLELAGDGLGLEVVDAPLDELVAGDADADGEPGADLGPDGVQDLAGEADPVLEGAAVVVVADVGGRRHERAEQVAVGRVEFDAVEAALLRPVERPRRSGHEVGDLAHG